MQHLRSKTQTQLLIAYWVNAFIGWQVEIYSWERIDFLNFENKHFKLPVSIFETGSTFENYFGANKSSKLMFILLNQLFESVVKSPLVL